MGDKKAYRRSSHRGLTDAFLVMRCRKPGAAVGKNEVASTVGSMQMDMRKPRRTLPASTPQSAVPFTLDELIAPGGDE